MTNESAALIGVCLFEEVLPEGTELKVSATRNAEDNANVKFNFKLQDNKQKIFDQTIKILENESYLRYWQLMELVELQNNLNSCKATYYRQVKAFSDQLFPFMFVKTSSIMNDTF